MIESERFEKWFNSEFLFSRDPTSILMNSGHKTIEAKRQRICEVCKRMLDNPKQPIEELRKEIAVDMFVSMRCSLDYLNYAKLILEKYVEQRRYERRKETT